MSPIRLNLYESHKVMEIPSYFINSSSRKQIVFLFASILSNACGQDQSAGVFKDSTDVSLTPSWSQSSQLSSVKSQRNQDAAITSPWSIGPVNIRPRTSYQFVSGNGIRSSPGVSSDTEIHSFSPGVLFEIGKHWSLDHSTTFQYYSNDHFEDAIEHRTALAGEFEAGNWELGLKQSYGLTAQPMIETASQNKWKTIATAVDASRSINERWRINMSLNQRFTILQDSGNTLININNSRTWDWMNWADYQVSDKLSVGSGFGVGLDVVANGTDMLHQSLQGRVSWKFSDKITLKIAGGGQIRQMLDIGLEDADNAVYSTSLVYEPTQTTRLSVNTGQVVRVSSFAGQFTKSTTVNIGAHQRLMGTLFMTVLSGFSVHDYNPTSTSLMVQRKDKNHYIEGRLSLPFLKRAELSGFYHYGDLFSDQPLYSFTTRQIGVEVSYRF